MRIGQGFDVHQLVEGRQLIIGGVTIPYEKGDWKSHDNFFGGEPYGGRIIVFYNSVQENHGLQPVDELNSDMSSSLGKPRSSERGGCHSLKMWYFVNIWILI